MITQATRTHTIPTSLQSPRAKLVYLFLSTNGTSTINELQDGLHMKKISLYSILKTLQKQDIVLKDGDSYTLA